MRSSFGLALPFLTLVIVQTFSSAVVHGSEIRVGCPLYWPESIMPRAAAKKAEVWMYAVSNLHPTDDNSYPVEMTKPNGISIDCQYTNGRRLTVAVPGITRYCEAEYVPGGEHLSPKAEGAVCLTRPAADGTMGPIRIYIVEPVTLAIRIDGLGLRMSRAEILAVAEARGFEIVEGENGTGPLRMRFGDEDFVVEFAKIGGTSKSVDIIYTPGTPRYGETAYRFGLDPERVYHGPPGKESFSTKRWKSRMDSAVIEKFKTDDPRRNLLRLYDTAAE